MEEIIYTVELGDGTTFENLTLNGNNFVSKVEISEDDFSDLSHVTITDSEGNSEEMENVELIQLMQYSDGWYFILRQLCQEEINQRNVEAQTFYTAMMTDTLLEEEEA